MRTIAVGTQIDRPERLADLAAVRRVAAAMALLLAVCAPMTWELGRWPLADPDEGRNAEVAREMLAGDRWAIPQLAGLPFLDKPPLLFWAIAETFRVLGPSEAAARLPSVAGAVGLVLVTLALAHSLLGRRAALRAAVVVATAPLLVVYARLTIFDVPFTLLVSLALYALVRRRCGGDAMRWWPLAGLAMALATLTKGPVGIALPLLAWAAARGALPAAPARPARLPLAVAVAVVVVVVGPWLALVVRDEPGFLRYALIDETLLRFTSPARFHRGGPWYYPVLMTAAGLGTWSIALLGTARRLGGATPRERIALRFAARAAAAILLFFTVCASKRPGYVLPAFPLLAIVVAVGLRVAPPRAASAWRLAAAVAMTAGAAALAVVHVEPEVIARLHGDHGTAAFVDATVVTTAAGVVCAWGLLVVTLGRRWPLAPITLAAAFGPGLYLALLHPLDAYAAARSTRALARVIPADATVIAYRHFRPSLPFYLGRPVVVATDDGHELTSNYVEAQAPRFLRDGRLVHPSRVRTMLHDRPWVVTTASWAPPFLRAQLAPVGRDADSTVWSPRD